MSNKAGGSTSVNWVDVIYANWIWEETGRRKFSKAHLCHHDEHHLIFSAHLWVRGYQRRDPRPGRRDSSDDDVETSWCSGCGQVFVRHMIAQTCFRVYHHGQRVHVERNITCLITGDPSFPPLPDPLICSCPGKRDTAIVWRSMHIYSISCTSSFLSRTSSIYGVSWLVTNVLPSLFFPLPCIALAWPAHN